jgi:hypothetical protein
VPAPLSWYYLVGEAHFPAQRPCRPGSIVHPHHPSLAGNHPCPAQRMDGNRNSPRAISHCLLQGRAAEQFLEPKQLKGPGTRAEVVAGARRSAEGSGKQNTAPPPQSWLEPSPPKFASSPLRLETSPGHSTGRILPGRDKRESPGSHHQAASGDQRAGLSPTLRNVRKMPKTNSQQGSACQSSRACNFSPFTHFGTGPLQEAACDQGWRGSPTDLALKSSLRLTSSLPYLVLVWGKWLCPLCDSVPSPTKQFCRWKSLHSSRIN